MPVAPVMSLTTWCNCKFMNVRAFCTRTRSEVRGVEVIVANARESRAVPGRKSDVNDAQWLQRLHACGLLRPSFRPSGDIAALRAYLRLRERHLDYAAAHIQHMAVMGVERHRAGLRGLRS